MTRRVCFSKKIFCVVLAFMMIAGLFLPVAAAQVGHRDPATDPLAVLYDPDLGFVRPGDFLFGGMERGGGYVRFGIGRWSGVHQQFYYTEAGSIDLVQPSFAVNLTEVRLVLRGDTELVEAVVIYEDGTRFNPIRDFYADGEIVTITITNPPPGQAGEIFLSHRRTRGDSGATATVYINGQFARDLNASSWVTALSPHTMTRPVGVGTVDDPRPPGTEPPCIGEPPLPPIFNDVNSGHWFYSAVMHMREQGFMAGTGGNNFSPNATLSRAMMATVLHRMAGYPAVPPGTGAFDDVRPGQWYTAAIWWARGSGVVSGVGGNNFAPHSNITRQELVTIMHRYAQIMGYDTSVPASFNLNQFTDRGSVSDWAEEPMRWAVYVGLVSGVGNNMLAPGNTATRAECAMILYRWDTEIRHSLR